MLTIAQEVAGGRSETGSCRQNLVNIPRAVFVPGTQRCLERVKIYRVTLNPAPRRSPAGNPERHDVALVEVVLDEDTSFRGHACCEF